MVRVARLELTASWPPVKRATSCATPGTHINISHFSGKIKCFFEKILIFLDFFVNFLFNNNWGWDFNYMWMLFTFVCTGMNPVRVGANGLPLCWQAELHLKRGLARCKKREWSGWVLAVRVDCHATLATTLPTNFVQIYLCAYIQSWRTQFAPTALSFNLCRFVWYFLHFFGKSKPFPYGVTSRLYYKLSEFVQDLLKIICNILLNCGS